MNPAKIIAILALVLSAALASVGPAAAQGLEATAPSAGVEGRITRAKVDKPVAAPGASVKLLGELRITEVTEYKREQAEMGVLARTTERVDGREGGPVENQGRLWFLVLQDGKPIASQELSGPFSEGKVFTHTFVVQAPEKPGPACLELAAVRSLHPLDRMDFRNACLVVQGAPPGPPRAEQDGPLRVEPDGPSRVDAPSRPAGVLDPSKMTRQQFEALSPDAKLQVGDRTLTKRDLPRLADEELQKTEAWHRTQSANVKPELAAEQAKFDQARKIDLTTAGAEIMKSLAAGPGPGQIKGDIVDIESPECLARPKITGFMPGSKVTPGGTIVMFGCGFAGNSEMRLHFGLSGGDVVVMPQLWEPGVFAGVIPSDIVARPQTGFLLVHTNLGVSNPWFVDFIPEEEVRLLSGGDIDCSDGAFTKDKCHRESSCGGSMCGSHTNYAFWPEAGKDRVQGAELGYGWTYHSMGFTKSSNDGDATAEYNGDPTRPKVTVTWHTEPFGSIAYNVKIFIKGPKGIPHVQGTILDRPSAPPPPPAGVREPRGP